MVQWVFFPHWGSHRWVESQSPEPGLNVTPHRPLCFPHTCRRGVYLTTPLTFLTGHWPLRGRSVPCQLPFTAYSVRLPWILLGRHHSSSVRIHYLVLVDSPVHPLPEPALLLSTSSWSSLFSICNSVHELSWVPVTVSFSTSCLLCHRHTCALFILLSSDSIS